MKPLLTRVRHNWKLVLATNVLLGLSLWFGMFTDFEFRNPSINLLYPFFALGIGLWSAARSDAPNKALRNFLCLPSIVGGLPYIFFAMLVIVNPFAWSLANRITSRELVNSYMSPDGSKTAEVYIFPGSNYEMKTYNVEAKLRYRFLPFVVRHILGNNSDLIFRYDEIKNYKLNWVSNDQLNIMYDGKTISNRDKTIFVKKTQFVMPMPFKLLLFIFQR